MRGADGATGYRRDQRDLVSGVQGRPGVGIFLVDGHDHGHAVGQIPDSVERVGHPRALGQLEFDLAGAGAFTQPGKKSDSNLHGLKG